MTTYDEDFRIELVTQYPSKRTGRGGIFQSAAPFPIGMPPVPGGDTRCSSRIENRDILFKVPIGFNPEKQAPMRFLPAATRHLSFVWYCNTGEGSRQERRGPSPGDCI
ncbi:MAG: hypothetical protein LBU46_01680 [Candidatus Accumulibacter sp.]|jgi:hypothetical protein|nr:hypothetical protein [Accumulibacter sp.]